MSFIRKTSAFIPGVALGIALLLAVAWAITGRELESWVTVLGLVAALVGFVIDPKVRRVQLRRGILRDLAHELYRDLLILRDPKFVLADGSMRVYPRLAVSVTEAGLSSGQFSSPSDAVLYRLLHGWSEVAREFNHRLDLAEFYSLQASKEDRVGWQYRLGTGATIRDTRSKLDETLQWLVTHYERESGISLHTVLFSDTTAA